VALLDAPRRTGGRRQLFDIRFDGVVAGIPGEQSRRTSTDTEG
jgi:hypothetical protein